MHDASAEGSAQGTADMRLTSATAEISITIDGCKYAVTVEARGRHVLIAVDGKPPALCSPAMARISAMKARAGGHHELAHAIETAADETSEASDA